MSTVRPPPAPLPADIARDLAARGRWDAGLLERLAKYLGKPLPARGCVPRWAVVMLPPGTWNGWMLSDEVLGEFVGDEEAREALGLLAHDEEWL